MSNYEKDLKTRTEGSLSAYKNNIASIRAGRASSSLLDQVKVEVYGSLMPLNQLATVTVQDPTLLNVQVWDKNNIASVEKAIRTADLGLNPTTDGDLVRVPIPKLSEERRAELVKVCAGYAEQAKISIRNVRRDVLDGLKKQQKDGDLSEDELKTNSDNVQKIVDDVVKEIDDLHGKKKEEIMVV